MKIFVAVTGEGKRRETGFPGIDAQFFLQFADQRSFRRLSGLDFAAGKLPQASHGLALGALRKQNAPVRIDQGNRGNQNRPHER